MFNFNTFTFSVPNNPKNGFSIVWSTISFTVVSSIFLAAATRFTCTYALSGVMSGSRPEPLLLAVKFLYPLVLRQKAFTHTDILRRYLNQLIVTNELHALFKA